MAYLMALDQPDGITSLALLDIIPPVSMWNGMSTSLAIHGIDPVKVRRATFAPHATGHEIDSGHFLVEENPQATLAALLPFLTDPA